MHLTELVEKVHTATTTADESKPGALVLNRKAVETIVDATLQSMVNALMTGDSISLKDFGVLEVRTQKARMARNPKTGEKVQVGEKKTVKFRISPKLKSQLSNGVPVAA